MPACDIARMVMVIPISLCTKHVAAIAVKYELRNLGLPTICCGIELAFPPKEIIVQQRS
jgi:hypothetical protein